MPPCTRSTRARRDGSASRVHEPGFNRVALEFSDDGRGIPPDQIGRVFDPFFTTARQRGSTGLGLHIVYNLVVPDACRAVSRCGARPGAERCFASTSRISSKTPTARAGGTGTQAKAVTGT